jgi:hypothetical protein
VLLFPKAAANLRALALHLVKLQLRQERMIEAVESRKPEVFRKIIAGTRYKGIARHLLVTLGR